MGISKHNTIIIFAVLSFAISACSGKPSPALPKSSPPMENASLQATDNAGEQLTGDNMATHAVDNGVTPLMQPPPVPFVPKGQTASRPTNGQMMSSPDSLQGDGLFKITNELDDDMVTAVLEVNGKLQRIVYVWARNQVYLDKLPPGVYKIFIATGANWDEQSKIFSDRYYTEEIDKPIMYPERAYIAGKTSMKRQLVVSKSDKRGGYPKTVISDISDR